MRKNSLRKIRESMMISKAELARRANISPMTVARIEKDLPCRIETKLKIISALEYDIADENELVASLITDNGGRRLGLGRRQFLYDKHIPERRSDQKRRNRLDRRLKPRKSE